MKAYTTRADANSGFILFDFEGNRPERNELSKFYRALLSPFAYGYMLIQLDTPSVQEIEKCVRRQGHYIYEESSKQLGEWPRPGFLTGVSSAWSSEREDPGNSWLEGFLNTTRLSLLIAQDGLPIPVSLIRAFAVNFMACDGVPHLRYAFRGTQGYELLEHQMLHVVGSRPEVVSVEEALGISKRNSD